MCTFNIVLDDNVVNTARKSFLDDASMTTWMEEQITILLNNYSATSNASHKENTSRKPHKHDTLMGIISDASEIDIKRAHLSEKYEL